MIGAFCEIYGNSIRNRVLEYFLENSGLDIAASDLASELEISRPKVYEILDYFFDKKVIFCSRIVGRTRLFKLNEESSLSKLYLKNFDDCLKLVVSKKLVLAKA